MFTCVDNYPTLCFGAEEHCSKHDYYINKVGVRAACPRTCGLCSQPALTCSNRLCQNNAVCIEYEDPVNPLVRFDCRCVAGFYGKFCELSE